MLLSPPSAWRPRRSAGFHSATRLPRLHTLLPSTTLRTRRGRRTDELEGRTTATGAQNTARGRMLLPRVTALRRRAHRYALPSRDYLCAIYRTAA